MFGLEDELQDRIKELEGMLAGTQISQSMWHEEAEKWEKIATILYEGYKGMISGKPWTEEGVKKIDEAMKQYEQAKEGKI